MKNIFVILISLLGLVSCDNIPESTQLTTPRGGVINIVCNEKLIELPQERGLYFLTRPMKDTDVPETYKLYHVQWGHHQADTLSYIIVESRCNH